MILSGGANNGNTISEAEKMYQILQKRNIPEIRPDINISLEEDSCDTAKNIRNSVWMILDSGIAIPEGKILILTSDFHRERTRQFAEHISATEFPGLKNVNFEVIGAEPFVSEKYKNRILSHPQWRAEEENFVAGELRGLAKPVNEREYNKPENPRIYTGK